MVKEGYPFLIIGSFIAITLFFSAGFFNFTPLVYLSILFAGLTLFIAYFFRNPERTVPTEKDIIVSPADGRVTRVEENENGKFVSIFLSPLDVHVNRSPIAGKITEAVYTKGKKMPATSNTASIVNERNSLFIQGEKVSVVCTQIAGIVARRIVCWKKAGDSLGLGERFGLIKFSSRTDLQMPANVDVLVKVDDKVKGGETIIARIVE